MRYGDDILIIENDLIKLKEQKELIIDFLKQDLYLEINQKNWFMGKNKQGIRFLGMDIFPKGRRLNKSNQNRIKERLNIGNVSSYRGTVINHSNGKSIKKFNWLAFERLKDIL